MEDFVVEKIAFFSGPGFYLNRRACVFNLYLNPEGRPAAFYEPHLISRLPGLEARFPDRMAWLFAETVLEVLRMGIELRMGACSVHAEGDGYVIAVEYLDRYVTEDALYLVRDWFRAIESGKGFDFDNAFSALQADFDGTVYGGPTIYSLIEAGMRREIPVHYLYEESQFQWGYGKRQLRGRSTTFHVDSIKDTEFTTFKDMVKDFLTMCGFPTPAGRNCFTEQHALSEAEALGYPVVVKPLAGHKGEGVTTGITDPDGVREAFQLVVDAAQAQGERFEGAIVERQVSGTDHRLLTVGGRCVAVLKRLPAYVDGDGARTIEALIAAENDTPARLDNARSPLARIRVDEDLIAYLAGQGRTLDQVPESGERVFLRRVANISAGGVSIDVTDAVHPKNRQLAEDIAAFFGVTCLGIDVLAADIARPWDAGDFGIIEINAGPGVFMHLAPAVGRSIDVPGMVIAHHFPTPASARIPIVAGNRISRNLADLFCAAAAPLLPSGDRVGMVTGEGIFFDGRFFGRNPAHDQNIKIVLRHPKVGLALFAHDQDAILDYGIYHQGADLVILNAPGYAEKVLKRDLLPGGYLVMVREESVTVFREAQRINSLAVPPDGDPDAAVMEAVRPLLPELMARYGAPA